MVRSTPEQSGDASQNSSAAGQVTLELRDGRRLVVAADQLHAGADGTLYLAPCAPAPQGPAQKDRTYRAEADSSQQEAGNRIVVPVVEEQLDISKREVVTGGVRVTTRTQSHEEVVDVPLSRQTVHVERIPVDRFVDAPVANRQEGDTLVVPIVEEVLVVEKRLKVREELRITTRRGITHAPQHATLRKQEATIERIPAENRGSSR